MFKTERLTPWAVADIQPFFPPRYYTVETTISELNTVGTTGRSYQFAGALKAPPVRTFKVKLPTLGYFPNTEGLPDLNCRPELNMAVLERFYRTKTTAEPFWFHHPNLGDVQVRFGEPLKITEGRPGGLGYLAPLELTLVEIPDSQTASGNRTSGVYAPDRWGDLDIFEFQGFTISSEYEPQGVTLPLGGNYSVTLRPAKPEMRKFRLTFPTLLWKLNTAGEVDWTTCAAYNLGRLEYFYQLRRNNTAFCFPHPVYGRLKVRFAEPPTLPSGRVNGGGWTDPVEILLVEMP